MKLILPLLVTFFSATLTAQQKIEPKNITIVRDSFGIPHIFAKTDAEVSYGLAWAHAEDDFKSLQEVVLPAKGLMGRVLGKAGRYRVEHQPALRAPRNELRRPNWHARRQ